jgi:signal transduction histidine kinase
MRPLAEAAQISGNRLRIELASSTFAILPIQFVALMAFDEKQFIPAPNRRLIFVLICGMLGVAAVGEVDELSGPEIALAIFYLVPICICTWLSGCPIGIILAVFAAVVSTFLDIHGGRPYRNPFVPYWNGAVRLSIFSIIAILVSIIRRLTHGLQELVRQRTAELEMEIHSRKEVERVVTEISAHEQQRLGADLHDQLAGHLTGLAFHAKSLAEGLQSRGEPETTAAEQLVTYLNQALKQLRAFCRLLAPVDTGNLEPGLTRLGAQIETAFGVTCIVQTPKEPPQLGLNRARLMYNITQEAVRGAVEKRMAKNVEINLEQEGSLLRLTVVDDGEPVKEPASPADVDLDVRVMRYRAETLGGQISVGLDEKGKSTLVCKVPIDLEAAPFPPMS